MFSRLFRWHMKSLNDNIAGVGFFVLVTYLLLFVPQLSSIWWLLPYNVTRDDFLLVLGFWVFVPAVTLFYVTCWLVLAKLGCQKVAPLLLTGCVVAVILVVMRVLPAVLGRPDMLGWRIGLFLVPVIGAGYYLSWLPILQPYRYSGVIAPPAAWRNTVWPAPFRPLARKNKGWGRGWLRVMLTLLLPVTFANLVLLSVCWALSVKWSRRLHVWCLAGRRGTLAAAFAVAVSLFLIVLALHLTKDVLPDGWVTGLSSYPLALVFAGAIVWPLLVLAFWIGMLWRQSRHASALSRSEPSNGASMLTTSILLLLIVAPLVAEFLWIATGRWPYIFSYRLYTIWALAHLGFGLLALGSWTDALHCLARPWPFRQSVLVGTAIAAYVLASPTALPPAMEKEAAIAPDWHQCLWDRIEHVQKQGKGPVVVVAASGGGSRAALFTALVYDHLSKEPFPTGENDKQHSWMDRVVLVSSVSGGSLGTAHVYFRDPSAIPGEPPLSTLESELLQRFAEQYADVKRFYSDEKLAKLVKTFEQLDKEADPDLKSIVYSKLADDMCTDFMAPLLRATLADGIERGEGLSQFWEQRFGWRSHERDPHNLEFAAAARPLLLLNATNVADGNRFVFGFPQLPKGVFRAAVSNWLQQSGALSNADKPDPGRKGKYPAKTHRIDMVQGQEYVIEALSAFDSYLRLVDPKGKELAKDDDSRKGRDNSLDARIRYRAEATQTNTIMLSSYNGQAEGKYVLRVRCDSTAGQTANAEEIAKLPHASSLADFWPSYRVRLSDAVRVSANFPWGVQSCFISRPLRKYDFAGNRELRTALFADPVKLVALLPSDFDLVVQGERIVPRLDLDGMQRAAVERLRDNVELPTDKEQRGSAIGMMEAIVKHLERVASDPNVPGQNVAAAILEELDQRAGQDRTAQDEQIRLLDGGVNDNTGVATLAEVLSHLDRVFAWEKDKDNPNSTAGKILKRLRDDGVIVVEIDSGAKPLRQPVAEVKVPLQALENVSYLQAFGERQRRLEDIKRLLSPFATTSIDDDGKLHWVFHHVFLCNHSSERDVMTAWSLGPDDKARIMATFFCEQQKWRELLKKNGAFRNWMSNRNTSREAERQLTQNLKTVGKSVTVGMDQLLEMKAFRDFYQASKQLDIEATKRDDRARRIDAVQKMRRE